YERVRVEDCDIIFLAVSSEFANVEAEALSRRAIVIDNSSAFRYRPDIPLIVPEINAHEIGSARLIANPNCTTALLSLALGPLNRAFGLNRVIVATYQAASGAGSSGMEELMTQLRFVVAGEQRSPAGVFPHQLALNLIPHIDRFEPE